MNHDQLELDLYRLIGVNEAKDIVSSGIQLDLPYPTFLNRIQDDCDGDFSIHNRLTVAQGPDGDMYIQVGNSEMLRFRTYEGGTRSIHTHNALRLLAHAIMLDDKKHPEPK